MIINSKVPAGGVRIFTTATGSAYALTTVFFCNTSENLTEILNLYLVTKGKEANSEAQIACNIEIEPTDTFVLDTERLVLEDGDYLYGASQSGNISAVVSAMNLG